MSVGPVHRPSEEEVLADSVRMGRVGQKKTVIEETFENAEE